MSTPLTDLSKTALVAKAESLERKADRSVKEGEALMVTLGKAMGCLITGPATAGLVGLLEGRVRDKHGNMLSLGPIPLPVLVGLPALIGTVIPNIASTQLSYVAASNFGLASGTLGRAYGTAWKAKADADKRKGTSGVGEDGYNEAERELIAA